MVLATRNPGKVREIIAIVSEVARGLPSGGQDPLDDGMPGG